jgi:acetyl-CoA carboxylase carboxyl transferase subunit beta
MSWLTNFVLPKIRAVVAKKEVPDNLWQKCPNCGQMLFRRDLEATLNVCSNCGSHLRLGAVQRVALLFDEGRSTAIELPKPVADPLKFRDLKRYADRLKEAQGRVGGRDAMIVAHGAVGGLPAVVACFDFDFMGGSMGIAVGDALLAAARLAVL